MVLYSSQHLDFFKHKLLTFKFAIDLLNTGSFLDEVEIIVIFNLDLLILNVTLNIFT